MLLTVHLFQFTPWSTKWKLLKSNIALEMLLICKVLYFMAFQCILHPILNRVPISMAFQCIFVIVIRTITLHPRWIHVMAWRCFHVDIWFYLKIEINVIFSTLIPRDVFHVDSTCFPRWIHVFSTLNQRDVFHVESTSGPHVVSTLIFGSIWKFIPCPVFNVEST